MKAKNYAHLASKTEKQLEGVKALQALCTLWLQSKTRNQWCFTNNNKTQNLAAEAKPDMWKLVFM